MITGILETLQEVSGILMTSRLIERLAGAFFVSATLLSGAALIITLMYLASPKGFEERLSKVLVEKPVLEAPAGEGETAGAEEATEGE